MKRIIYFILLCCCLILMVACGSVESVPEAAPDQEDVAAEEAASTTSVAAEEPVSTESTDSSTSTSTSGTTTQDVIRLLDKTMSDVYNDGSSTYRGYEIVSSVVVFRIVYNGGHSLYASGYDMSSVEEDIDSTCSLLYERLKDYGYHASVILLDDVDEESYLYASVDGEAF